MDNQTSRVDNWIYMQKYSPAPWINKKETIIGNIDGAFNNYR